MQEESSFSLSIFQDANEQIKYFSNTSRNLMDNSVNSIFAFLEKRYRVQIKTYISGTHVYDWIVPEREKHVSGIKLTSMGALKIGDLSFPGDTKKTLLFCCYLDKASDESLVGLTVVLKLIETLQSKDQLYTYRFAFLQNSVGYAAYLSAFYSNNIQEAIHLTDTNINVLQSGHNPLAKNQLNTLSFKNTVLVNPREVDLLQFINGYQEKNILLSI